MKNQGGTLVNDYNFRKSFQDRTDRNEVAPNTWKRNCKNYFLVHQTFSGCHSNGPGFINSHETIFKDLVNSEQFELINCLLNNTHFAVSATEYLWQ